MVRIPGAPGWWVSAAAGTVIPVIFLPGWVSWPTWLAIASTAMLAAVTRAYQDAERAHTTAGEAAGAENVSCGGPS